MALDIILMGVTYCVHANAIKYMNQATYQTSLLLKPNLPIDIEMQSTSTSEIQEPDHGAKLKEHINTLH